MYYCDENPVDHLDKTEYFEKIENEVNNYINLYNRYVMTLASIVSYSLLYFQGSYIFS